MLFYTSWIRFGRSLWPSHWQASTISTPSQLKWSLWCVQPRTSGIARHEILWHDSLFRGLSTSHLHFRQHDDRRAARSFLSKAQISYRWQKTSNRRLVPSFQHLSQAFSIQHVRRAADLPENFEQTETLLACYPIVVLRLDSSQLNRALATWNRS